MTTLVQVLALGLTAAGGTAVVLTRDPARQVFVSSLYGMVLAILFVTFQAPDVAFSEVAVGSVVLPLMVVLALVKVRENSR